MGIIVSCKSICIIILAIVISSCASTIRSETFDEGYESEFEKKSIYILKNLYSIKHTNILLPPQYYIDEYENYSAWYKFVPKIEDIDLKIATELLRYGYKTKMVEDISEIEEKDAIVIYSEDIWQWDLRHYMHILKVHISYKHGNKLEIMAKIGSEGSKTGFHNFPSPDSEIPRIIKEVLNKD